MEAQGLCGDTTETEDLMDSSGVAVFPPVAPNVILDPTLFPELEGEFHTDSGHSDSEQVQYRSKLDGADRQLSAKGKLIIKKYFQETRPIELPRDHPVIALTADKMHAVLRTVSDESVLSSYHRMKSLLFHATRGVPQDKKRPMPKRCATPARPDVYSSGDESSFGGHSSDGNTSGAFITDEDPYQLGSISGTDYLSEFDPLALTPKARTDGVAGTSWAETVTPTSGSGYSSTDYQPLSTLGRLPEQETQVRSPPRKRRRLLSKPGKVMKDAYFKRIQWTRTFVSGPVDPVHNRLSFTACYVKLMFPSSRRAPGRFSDIIKLKDISEKIRNGDTPTCKKLMRLLGSLPTKSEAKTVMSLPPLSWSVKSLYSWMFLWSKQVIVFHSTTITWPVLEELPTPMIFVPVPSSR